MKNISFFIINQRQASPTTAANFIFGYIHGPAPEAFHIGIPAGLGGGFYFRHGDYLRAERRVRTNPTFFASSSIFFWVKTA